MFSSRQNFRVSTVTLQYQSHLYNSLLCNIVITNTHKLVSSLLLFEGEKYEISLLNQFAKVISLKIYNAQSLVQINQLIFDLQDFPRCENLEGVFEITEKFLRIKKGDPKQFFLFAGFGFQAQRKKIPESECYEERKLRQMLGAIHYNQIGKKYYSELVEKAQRQNTKALHQEVLRSRSKRLSNRQKQYSNPQSRKNLNSEICFTSRKKLSEKKLRRVDQSPETSQASIKRTGERMSRFNERRESILGEDPEFKRISKDNEDSKSRDGEVTKKKMWRKRTTIEWKIGLDKQNNRKEEEKSMKIEKQRKKNLRWVEIQNATFLDQKQFPSKNSLSRCFISGKRNKNTTLDLKKNKKIMVRQKQDSLQNVKVQQQRGSTPIRSQQRNKQKEGSLKSTCKKTKVYCLNIKEALSMKLKSKSNMDEKIYYTKFEDHIINYIKKLEDNNKSVNQYDSCRHKKSENLKIMLSECQNTSVIPLTLAARMKKQAHQSKSRKSPDLSRS